MNIETLRDYCLAFPGAEEGFPFGPGTIVFKIKNKIFLLAGLDNNPLQFNVKCRPDSALELREQYGCVLPGWHMNKKHWNTVIVDGSVGDKILKEWVRESYQLVKK